METNTIDRLFLELSQVTQAKTQRESQLESESADLLVKLHQLEVENSRLRGVIESIYEARATVGGVPNAFQERVKGWTETAFGHISTNDILARSHRLLEEALEFAQAVGCTKEQAGTLLDYVYSRETGEPEQEAGGVMITLAALCTASGLSMHECGEKELSRVWEKIEKIREKDKTKPFPNHQNQPFPQNPEKSE